MRTKVRFGQHEHPSGAVRFKLVKSPRYYCKLAPFSNSIHYCLKVRRL